MSTVSLNSIRINQLGFYPDSIKTFAAVGTASDTFYVLSQRGEKVFTGSLRDRGLWQASAENMKTGDFSSLSEPGLYTVVVDDCEPSLPFIISEGIYSDAARDVLGAFEFQRCVHPDIACPFHPSSGRPEGGLNSPGGWYDAGDYGKYVVNGAFSAGIMLSLHEILPEAYDKDGHNPLLDEVRYELDWLMTMLDKDGGVFHKITSLVHDDFVLPEDARAPRLVIGKSTAAALDFAAVMAQASRIWSDRDSDFSRKALAASERAWKWSCKHREEYFTNPEGCNTGEYGDSDLKEEFFWAAAELYATTGDRNYMASHNDDLGAIAFPVGENWRQFTANLGYFSLLASEKVSPEDKSTVKAGLKRLADDMLEKMRTIPYDIPVDDFQWGSNSDILDGAMILALAHFYLKDRKYLDGTVQTTDYLLGKNALGLSFLTGYGVKAPFHPHHRLFVEMKTPVAGFIVGGPNGNREDAQDLRNRGLYYPSALPAKAYVDYEESYASNEICINWNAPAVFALAYLEIAFA